jgi:hypothetical protein
LKYFKKATAILCSAFMLCSINVKAADTSIIDSFESIFEAEERSIEKKEQSDADEAEKRAQGEAELQALSVVPLILDVDMSSDVDDVTAFRIAEELDYLGVIDIKGVAFSITPNRNGNNIRGAEGILDYAGLTDVPVADCAVDAVDFGDYWGVLWKYKTTNHVVYNNAVNMYKDILKALPEGQKARIVTTGFLTNVAAMLQDPEGYQLITEKVDGVFVAGGSDGLSWNLSYREDARAASTYVNTHCPCDVYYIQDALGANQVGGHLTKIDTTDSDILSQAYAAFGLADGQNYGNCDGTAVYCAAYKDVNYNDLFTPIPMNIYINPDNGSLTGTETTEPTNRYRFIATQCINEAGVFSKYMLYDSQLYTNVMDALIEGDYNRKHGIS